MQAALGEALTGRTSVVIAHRLSTIRAADQILVLEDGPDRGTRPARRPAGAGAAGTPSCTAPSSTNRCRPDVSPVVARPAPARVWVCRHRAGAEAAAPRRAAQRRSRDRRVARIPPTIAATAGRRQQIVRTNTCHGLTAPMAARIGSARQCRHPWSRTVAPTPEVRARARRVPGAMSERADGPPGCVSRPDGPPSVVVSRCCRSGWRSGCRSGAPSRPGSTGSRRGGAGRSPGGWRSAPASPSCRRRCRSCS